MRAVPLSRLPLGGAALLVLALAACTEPPGTPTDPDFGKAPTGPSVSSTDPSDAPRDTTLDVTISGSGFDAGSRASFLLAGSADPKVRTNSTRYVSSTQLVANVTIDADAVLDYRDVQVTASTGKKGIGTELFVVAAYEYLPSGTIAQDVNSNRLVVGLGSGVCVSYWDAALTATALPVPAGYCGGSTRGISETGYIVGMVSDGSTFGAPTRWIPTGSGYTVELLPSAPNGGPTVWDVDDQGDVLGNDYVNSSNRPTVWSSSAGWTPLAMPAGATDCEAHAISGNGAVVARCVIESVWAPVYWSGAAAAPIILPRLPGGSGLSHNADGINTAGTVIVGMGVASQSRKSTVTYAVRWTLVDGTWQVEALPSLGGNARAFDVDDAGNIVGWSFDSKSRKEAVVWEGGTTIRRLGTRPNWEGLAIGIAPTGRTAVGYFSSNSGAGFTAVRWPF